MGKLVEYDFILAKTSFHFSEAKKLFQEYANSLNFDLSFQRFETELEEIHIQYDSPDGGLILVSYKNVFVGCAGIRKFENKTGELKRMYIQPSHRGAGLGKVLLEKVTELAVERGYDFVRLDTLKSFAGALHLYRQAGFKDIPAYRFNPSSEVLYLEKQLR